MKKNTKKLLALTALILMCAVCFLYGCSSEPADGNATKAPSGDVVTAAPATSGKTEDGFVFKKGDVSVIMNAPAADIIAALGEAKSYYESPSCAFEGMDKTYSYGSFDVTTYTNGGVDYISGVVIWDDSVETPEGLFIGASAADVQRIYGTEAAGKTNVRLEKGASALLILLSNDTVTSIQYLAQT